MSENILYPIAKTDDLISTDGSIKKPDGAIWIVQKDLDTFYNNGTFYCSRCTNTPIVGIEGYLEVISGTKGSYLMQRFTHGLTGNVYRRVMGTSNWNDWKLITGESVIWSGNLKATTVNGYLSTRITLQQPLLVGDKIYLSATLTDRHRDGNIAIVAGYFSASIDIPTTSSGVYVGYQRISCVFLDPTADRKNWRIDVFATDVISGKTVAQPINIPVTKLTKIG